MLDNFLTEIVGMGEMDRGIAEFFRELPGIARIFILAVFYTPSAELAAVSLAFSVGLSGNSKTKRRFYFHKKYTKYRMPEVFYGARKQVFFTFGPYVLVLFYSAYAATIQMKKA